MTIMRINKVLECMDYCFHVERTEEERVVALKNMCELRELVKQHENFKSKSLTEVIIELTYNVGHYKSQPPIEGTEKIIESIVKLGYIKKD